MFIITFGSIYCFHHEKDGGWCWKWCDHRQNHSFLWAPISPPAEGRQSWPTPSPVFRPCRSPRWLGLCHLPPGAGPLAGCGGKAIPDLLPGNSQDHTVVCLIGNLSSLQILVATIAFLLPSAEYSSVETDKKVSGPSARFSPEFVFLKTWLRWQMLSHAGLYNRPWPLSVKASFTSVSLKNGRGAGRSVSCNNTVVEAVGWGSGLLPPPVPCVPVALPPGLVHGAAGGHPPPPRVHGGPGRAAPGPGPLAGLHLQGESLHHPGPRGTGCWLEPQTVLQTGCCCLVAQSCLTLCNPIDCSTPGFPVLHQLREFAQTHVHRVGDAILSSHPLLSASPPAFNLSWHQGLF